VLTAFSGDLVAVIIVFKVTVATEGQAVAEEFIDAVGVKL